MQRIIAEKFWKSRDRTSIRRTVQRSASLPQCEMSHFLANVGTCNLSKSQYFSVHQCFYVDNI